ncbi:hypothetical protein [Bacillus velezensis]|uniref:hypothetical protein n=1 Tax=Bacillus velezensis TaxID=492670 RepID=UPI003EB788E5
MAKLDGVKTLDMVNGKITKVAYGGAEYVKAEGLPKKGDLVRAEEGGYDITYGAFYKITDDADHADDVRFLDDVDFGRVRFGDDYELFRKVAACTDPSVEDRVAKAEGEIESLKSDVAALKGAAEPKPERLKVGEYAKVVGNESGHYAEINEIVIVKRDDRDRMPFLCGKLNGNEAGIFYEDELVRATDEEVAEVKHAAKWAEIGREVGEYKEGDIVNNVGSAKCGLGEIVGNDYGDFWVNYSDPTYGICLEASDILELVTPVEARFDR